MRRLVRYVLARKIEDGAWGYFLQTGDHFELRDTFDKATLYKTRAAAEKAAFLAMVDVPSRIMDIKIAMVDEIPGYTGKSLTMIPGGKP